MSVKISTEFGLAKIEASDSETISDVTDDTVRIRPRPRLYIPESWLPDSMVLPFSLVITAVTTIVIYCVMRW